MEELKAREGVQTNNGNFDADERASFIRNTLLCDYNTDDTILGPVRTRVRDQIEYIPRSTKSLNGSHNRTPSDFSNNTSRQTPSSSTQIQRLVAVRYFLDRPGYGLHNSAVRLWFNPPAICTPIILKQFLLEQGIALDDLIIEIFLDKFQSFMLLEACDAANIEWDLQDTTIHDPGIINVRLTDTSYAQRLDDILLSNTSHGKTSTTPSTIPTPTTKKHEHANSTPVGLFSFSMMVGLETAALMAQLAPNSLINTSFIISHGPYMFFVGGLLQLIVSILQVLRNNIYGCVAFAGFGSFWFSNGLTSILKLHFTEPGSVADELLDESDHWGTFIRAFYVLMFTGGLLIQTFKISKLSTTLIAMLFMKILFQSVGGWSKTCQWCQVGFGWITSLLAFYVFLVEFTNQVYHREVFRTYKWSEKDSPEELFGAAGKGQTLYSKATLLRQARYPNMPGIRSAMSSVRKTEKVE